VLLFDARQQAVSNTVICSIAGAVALSYSVRDAQKALAALEPD